MSFQALFAAPPIIQVHAFAAIAALMIGTVQMLRPKGGTLHRATGYVWLLLMLVVSGSSFFIHGARTFGPFSPIHILSLITFINAPLAVWAARNGKIKMHRNAMLQLYWFALIGAGLFTLLPDRIMGQVVFGP